MSQQDQRVCGGQSRTHIAGAHASGLKLAEIHDSSASPICVSWLPDQSSEHGSDPLVNERDRVDRAALDERAVEDLAQVVVRPAVGRLLEAGRSAQTGQLLITCSEAGCRRR